MDRRRRHRAGPGVVRFYDPVTGTFLQRDPLSPVTRDPYGYTAGNPLNAIDPTGLFGIPGTDLCVDILDDSCRSRADGRSLNDSPQAVVDNRGTLATVAAVGFCLIPAVGWGSCAVAGTIALGFRVEQRIQDSSFSESMGANVADILLSYTTIGLSGAFSSLGEPLKGAWSASKGVEYGGRFFPAGYDAAALAGDELAKRENCESAASG